MHSILVIAIWKGSIVGTMDMEDRSLTDGWSLKEMHLRDATQ